MTITIHEPIPETAVLLVCLGRVKQYKSYQEVHIHPTIAKGAARETLLTIDEQTLTCLRRTPNSPLEFY